MFTISPVTEQRFVIGCFLSVNIYVISLITNQSAHRSQVCLQLALICSLILDHRFWLVAESKELKRNTRLSFRGKS